MRPPLRTNPRRPIRARKSEEVTGNEKTYTYPPSLGTRSAPAPGHRSTGRARQDWIGADSPRRYFQGESNGERGPYPAGGCDHSRSHNENPGRHGIFATASRAAISQGATGTDRGAPDAFILASGSSSAKLTAPAQAPPGCALDRSLHCLRVSEESDLAGADRSVNRAQQTLNSTIAGAGPVTALARRPSAKAFQWRDTQPPGEASEAASVGTAIPRHPHQRARCQDAQPRTRLGAGTWGPRSQRTRASDVLGPWTRTSANRFSTSVGIKVIIRRTAGRSARWSDPPSSGRRSVHASCRSGSMEAKPEVAVPTGGNQ